MPRYELIGPVEAAEQLLLKRDIPLGPALKLLGHGELRAALRWGAHTLSVTEFVLLITRNVHLRPFEGRKGSACRLERQEAQVECEHKRDA